MIDTLSTVMGLHGNRVQFTPDLMPADILGSEVLDIDDTGKRAFRFIEGPIFCQLLMADEINRASPRTQAALLQAMQEREVTVAGVHHKPDRAVSRSGHPEPAGAGRHLPLPEAQLDRFLVQIDVVYPDRDTERDILIATTGAAEDDAHEVFTAAELIDAQGCCAGCRWASVWSMRSLTWSAPAVRVNPKRMTPCRAWSPGGRGRARRKR